MVKKRSKKKTKERQSFRRVYREDLKRDLETPGIMQHIAETFRILFKNWKIFLSLLVVAVVFNYLFVGLMNMDNYEKAQNFLNEASADESNPEINNFQKAGLLLGSLMFGSDWASRAGGVATVASVFLFLVLWLTTIFLLRHLMAKQKVKLRDGLYNSMTPLIPTLIIMMMVFLSCLPFIMLVVAYSSAINTGFLNTPFYAFLFFGFAILMIIMSGYFLADTLMALIAVSAPGLRPFDALKATHNLMKGRKIKFILRVIALLIALLVICVVVLLPILLLDLAIGASSSIQLAPFCLNIVYCFAIIFSVTYLYLYYRWVLDYEEK